MASTPGFGSTTGTKLFPSGTAGTGTITASGANNIITGVGTLFSSQCKINGWIFIPTTSDLIQIKAIEGNTRIICTRNPLACAGVAFQIIAPDKVYKYIQLTSIGGNATISTPENGPATLPEEVTFEYYDNSGLGAIAVVSSGVETIYYATNK